MWSFPGSCENRGSGTQQASSDVVPVTGLEPVRGCPQGILSVPIFNFTTYHDLGFCETKRKTELLRKFP